MKDTHKLLFLGALAGGLVLAAAKALAWKRRANWRSLQRSRSDADVRRLDESVAPTAPF
jgi:hypothetical protein